MVDVRFPPSPGRTRCRRRGPRSQKSLLRRSRLRETILGRQPPSGSPGESGLEPLVFDMKVTTLSLNIRGFLHHQTELEAFLRVHGLPSIVGITETLLDASTKNIYLSEYVLVSRLDRRAGTGRGGGIALFVREEFESRLVHVFFLYTSPL